MKPSGIYAWGRRSALKWLPAQAVDRLKEIHYLRALRSFSLDEEPDLKVLQRLVQPDDRVIDIGANFGIYTAALSRFVGPAGRVYGVEPIPSTFQILRGIARKLRLHNTKLIQCAVSDRDGPVTMEIPANRAGEDDFYQACIVEDESAGGKFITARSMKIDTLLSEIGADVSFIKCDVEGYELHCVRGAEQLLARTRPSWLIELVTDLDKPHSASHDLCRLMAELGYEVWWFDGDKLIQRQSGQRSHSLNYFFLQPQHVMTLRRRAPEFFDS